MTATPKDRSVYDEAVYWDLAFRDETADEVAFVDALSRRSADRGDRIRSVYEPGCGGGRLVVALAAAGYEVVACDLSEPAVRYVRHRLTRRRLDAEVAVGDMRKWKPSPAVDLAFCPVNTFRHLLTEADAVAHLQTVAECVRPGGHYAIGLHLLPPDADPEDSESWTARHGRTAVRVRLDVTEFDRRRRIERLRFRLRIDSPKGKRTIESTFDYRIYTAAQLRSLLRKLPQWEHVSTHDFWWDLDEPLTLNDDLGDTVILLRRR